MNLENFFYLTASIYSIVSIIILAVILIFIVKTFKKFTEIEVALQTMAERGRRAAESAQNIMENGEKVFRLAVYKIFKKFFGRYEDDY